MKKIPILLAAVAAVWPSAASAISDEEFEQLYRDDGICYVLTEDDVTAPQVAVFDFVIVEDSLNHGYTSWSFEPCVPLSCPDGTFLVSGNLCAVDDPFAHIPVLDDKPGEVSTAELLLPRSFAEDSPFWAGRSKVAA